MDCFRPILAKHGGEACPKVRLLQTMFCKFVKECPGAYLASWFSSLLICGSNLFIKNQKVGLELKKTTPYLSVLNFVLFHCLLLWFHKLTNVSFQKKRLKKVKVTLTQVPPRPLAWILCLLFSSAFSSCAAEGEPIKQKRRTHCNFTSWKLLQCSYLKDLNFGKG